MNAATALTLSLLFAGSAVALVATDLAYTLTARLETLDGGVWRVFAVAPPGEDQARSYAKSPLDCAYPQLRLVVDNHRPVPAEPSVFLFYGNQTSHRVTVLSGVVALPAFGQHIEEFRIPDEFFDARAPDPTYPQSRPEAGVFVEGQLDDHSLYACVREAAS